MPNATETRIALPAPLTDDQFNARLLGGTPARVTMDGAGPDALGRRRFTCEWNSIHPVYCQRYAHAQCFHAVPRSIFIDGHRSDAALAAALT
jgi:hypothetical protein